MEKSLKIVLIAIIVILIFDIFYFSKDLIINCFTFNPIIKPTITGVVVKVNEHSINVMGIKDSNGLYSIGFTDEGNIGFKQGQEILITYNGFILDTYPGQLEKVYNIKIVKEKSDIEIPKHILKYCYGTSKFVEEIPQKLTQADAIERGYFVYNCLENKVYNRDKLDEFIEYTKKNKPTNKMSDDITIVVYNMNNEPIIHYLLFDLTENKYSYTYDNTRVTKWEIPENERNGNEISNKITTNDDIPWENYKLEIIEDTDFNVAIILLKAYNNDNNKYQDIEIARFMLDNVNVDITTKKEENTNMIILSVNDRILEIKPENNSSSRAFIEKLKEKEIVIDADDYGNFEKVGDLGFSLPTNDERITTEPGDLILYQGNKITLYYDINTWEFTRLGKVQNTTQEELKSILGKGSVKLKFSL